MIRILVAALLSISMTTSAFGAETVASEKYAKTPPTKTLITMAALIGASAALMVAGHKQYPERPERNPLTLSGAGLAGGTALVVLLHYGFKHPPGAPEPTIRDGSRTADTGWPLSQAASSGHHSVRNER